MERADLTPSNIVFELPDTSSMEIPEVCDLLGHIESKRLRLRTGDRSEHGPRYVIQRPSFSKLMSKLPTLLETVRIIDFGEAFPSTQPRSTLGVPISLGFFPPELCFGYTASPASDVWMLACLMYQTLGTPALFPCFFPVLEILVGTAVPILGPLPGHWRGRFDYEQYGHREDGELQNAEKVDPEWWWDEAMRDKSIRGRMESDLAPRFSSEQLDSLAALLGDMLAFEPEKRISVSEVVHRLQSASAMFNVT